MAPRTLVISDLHIGAPDPYSIVGRPVVLAALTAEIEHHQRLVLLGDLIELRASASGPALEAAAPILEAIGAAAGPECEIVYLPGNHDRALIAGWIRAQGEALEREAVVPDDASRALQRVLAALGRGGAAVSVRYPGVWLSDRIWAHHGHYLNRYLRPRQAYGLLAPGQGAQANPSDFEPRHDPHHHREPPNVPTDQWHARLHERLLPPGISPLTSHLLSRQMRRHAIPAMVRVAGALGVEAEYLLFGHVHRLGPMHGDRLSDWNGGGSGPLVLNTGAWRWEPVLVGRAGPPHPYWPGGAVVIEGDGMPHPVCLLQRVGREALVPQTSATVNSSQLATR